MKILIQGMYGFGDNMYQLGYIRTLVNEGAEVTIVTPWPELYEDLNNVRFQKPHTTLRTQSKNIKRNNEINWSVETSFNKRISVHYKAASVIPDDMARIFETKPTWGMKQFNKSAYQPKEKYVVVRPVTARKEWLNEARNPDPLYIDQVTRWLMREGYTVISVADLEQGLEWPIHPLPSAHTRLHTGQLTTADLLSLCQNAAAIIGGIGWIVPFAINNNVPALFVSGGNGGYNHPTKLVNETVDQTRMRFAIPEPMCMCTDNKHKCIKKITNLKGVYDDWKQIL